MRKRNK